MRPARATLGLGAALVLAGCGGVGEVASKGDVTNGKTQFNALTRCDGSYSCAGCHTLADAGAGGKVGPEPRHAFAYVRNAANKGDRFCQDTIANVVLDQIRFPSQNNLEPQYVMPAEHRHGQGRASTSRQYVASVAGLKPGKKAPKQSDACS